MEAGALYEAAWRQAENIRTRNRGAKADTESLSFAVQYAAYGGVRGRPALSGGMGQRSWKSETN